MEKRITEERERISIALLDPATTADQYKQLYAAQQALGWASNPEMARAPYDMIMGEPITEIGSDWGSPTELNTVHNMPYIQKAEG